MLKKLFKQKLRNLKFSILLSKVSGSYNDIADIDKECFLFSVKLLDNMDVLVSMHPENNSIYIESTITVRSDIINLKSYSTLSEIAFYFESFISTIVLKEVGLLSFSIGRRIAFSEINNIGSEIEKLKSTFLKQEDFLIDRLGDKCIPVFDLSMFANIDRPKYNLKEIGEKKDFHFGSWDNYIASESDTSDKDFLHLLQACKLFEYNNNLLLSEVGNFIADSTPFTNMIFGKSSESKFTIN